MKKSKKKVIKHRNEREIEKQKHLRNNRNKQHFTNEDFVVLCVCRRPPGTRDHDLTATTHVINVIFLSTNRITINQ